jgi:hypothetical protein
MKMPRLLPNVFHFGVVRPQGALIIVWLSSKRIMVFAEALFLKVSEASLGVNLTESMAGQKMLPK